MRRHGPSTTALRRAGTVLLLAALVACARTQPRAWRHAGATMGTTYAIQVPRLPPGTDAHELGRALDGLVSGIDQRMSTWKDDSEVSRFNASDSCAWFPVSTETCVVVAEALRVAERSQGALDPTLLPLVELWGFGPGGRRAPDSVPGTLELERARAQVDHRALQVRLQPPALRKAYPELRIDLSAVAKGFAIDALAEHLIAVGVADFLVELGGELRGRGRGPTGEPWRVAIESPAAASTTVPGLARLEAQAVLALQDGALATSGDARNAFELEGRRYGHVLDPRSGWPVSSPVASVTVLAASALRADALATALLVLGPEAGLALAEREGAEALFLMRAGASPAEYRTSGIDVLWRSP